jgi:DHA2 family multidrug resistance protein
MGLVFLPMNVVTFATLPSRFRTDGAAMMNLSRNTGGSIGIALASTMLAHNLQVSHADLAAHLTPYNLPVDPTLLGTYGELGEGVLRMVDGLVQRQATMIALLDDFHMFFLVSIFALPLAFFVRPQRRHGPGGRNDDEPLHVGME